MRLRALLLAGIACGAGGMALSAQQSPITTSVAGRAAYLQPIPGLTPHERARFNEGRGIFRLAWLVAPSGEEPRFDGAGPLMHRLSCIACHVGNGRGDTARGPDDVMRSTLVRLSIPGEGPHGEPLPDPTYGDQLQPDGIAGVPGEGQATFRWQTFTVTLADGAAVEMRRPELQMRHLQYGPLAADVMTSVRMASPVFGMGLLEAVPAETLQALADPDDKDGDGVSGRVNHIRQHDGRVLPGRFGLKANQPTTQTQVAAALAADMGITSALMAQENCMPAQTACAAAPSGGAPEISDEDLAALVFYVERIAPPARRDPGRADIAVGEALFTEIGCAACHVPALPTGDAPDFPQAAHQTIHPFTDMLLHDMGDDLADGRPDFQASGREWRTASLWGIGLADTVAPGRTYLHDGRARTLTEAILWHGGEAQQARERFAALSEEQRRNILDFLRDL